jgi:hypothetical protein
MNSSSRSLGRARRLFRRLPASAFQAKMNVRAPSSGRIVSEYRDVQVITTGGGVIRDYARIITPG